MPSDDCIYSFISLLTKTCIQPLRNNHKHSWRHFFLTSNWNVGVGRGAWNPIRWYFSFNNYRFLPCSIWDEKQRGRWRKSNELVKCCTLLVSKSSHKSVVYTSQFSSCSHLWEKPVQPKRSLIMWWLRNCRSCVHSGKAHPGILIGPTNSELIIITPQWIESRP